MAVVEPSLLGCGVGRCEPNQLRSASARVNVIAAAEDSMSDITELIGKARAGDAQASEHLFASLYEDLRRLAEGRLRGSPAMRATSLLHEAWLKLAKHGAFAPIATSDALPDSGGGFCMRFTTCVCGKIHRSAHLVV